MMNTQPPNQNQNNSQNPDQNNHPQPRYSPEANTRRTLYLISFIFLILNCVAVGVYGLWGIINYVVYRTSLGEINEITIGFIAFTDFVYLTLTIIFILSLGWLIPMTVLSHRYYKQVGTDQERGHLAFGICTLIFANLISGILLLVASSSFNNNQRYLN